MKSKNKIRYGILALCIAVLPLICFSVNASALKNFNGEEIDLEKLKEGLKDGSVVLVKGLQDDIFAKLKESAYINTVGNLTKYCIKAEIAQNSAEYYSEAMKNGAVFTTGGDWLFWSLDDKTVALWLEHLIEAKSIESLKGSVYCSTGKFLDKDAQKQDGNWRTYTGIFPIYATYIGKTNHYQAIICRVNGGTSYSGTHTRQLISPDKTYPNSDEVYCSKGVIRTSSRADHPEDAHEIIRIDGNLVREYPWLIMNYKGDDYEQVFDLNEAMQKWNYQTSIYYGYEYRYKVNNTIPPYSLESYKETYERYKNVDSNNYQLSGFHNGNQYLPKWEELGNYDSVDGYFNYTRDVNIKCGDYMSAYDDMDKAPSTAHGITLYDQNITDKRQIVAKRRYYNVNNEQKWDYPLTTSNNITNCTKALERIEWLRLHPNGINRIYENEEDLTDELNTFIGYEKDYGYEGIILKMLEDACNNMISEKTGLNAYAEIKQMLQQLKDEYGEDLAQNDPDTLDLINEGLEQLEAAEKAGTYLKVTGNENEPNGKVYECIDVIGLQRILDEYTPPSSVIPEDPFKDKKYNCYSNAGPLGWILCPIIEGVRSFIIEKYGEWIMPALQIDPVLFSGKQAEWNQTYQAWSVFRDIGNFAFILLFIFVIFSQISGIGIDNYGIKKILPKLFVCVVLINLSYIICQVSIDVCNIVGNQIGGFFQSISDRATRPSVIETSEGITIRATDQGAWGDVSTWGESYKQNWLGNSTLIIVIGALGVAAFLYKGLAVIIPVLMMVLSCAIAILGLIIILGLRQAAAVMLVVVSPVAFACYMLPNTKTIFDRWFKAFQGLLLAFPVCSALVYGGDLAATILLNAGNGNTWVIISAAVISVAPIFIIPKVIKKSMASISGAIMNFTDKTRHKATAKASAKLQSTRMGDRQRYNDNMRAQMRQASASAYGAKRGQKLLNKKKYQDPTKLRFARDKRTYNAALAAVNAENSSAQDAYENQFQNQDDAKIMDTIGVSVNNGKFNANMLVAGINRMTNDGNAVAMLRGLAKTDAYKEMMKNDPQANQRIADAMMGRRGNIIAQSIGKQMAKGDSVETMFESGTLRDKVQGAGVGVMASQTKDAFNMPGAENLFSDDQIRAGLSAGYGGDTDRAFGRMIERMQKNDDGTVNQAGVERVENIVQEMTPEQVSKMSEVGLAAVGGADTIIRKNEKAIKSLNSGDGHILRTNMNVNVGKALGIKDVGKNPDEIGTPNTNTNAGSGPAPQAPSPSPAPASDSGPEDPPEVRVDINH